PKPEDVLLHRPLAVDDVQLAGQGDPTPTVPPIGLERAAAQLEPGIPVDRLDEGTRNPLTWDHPSDSGERSDPLTLAVSASTALGSLVPSGWRGDAGDTAFPPVLARGKVIFGKYRLIEKIGEGGMGEVWRVWHVGLETERALKLIKPEIAQNDAGWRRFK